MGISSQPPAAVTDLTVRQVFDQHGAFVFRALRYFGVPEADLPDLFQEVFVIVHRKLQEFEGRAALQTWLYRICQRTAADHRKRAYVRREIVADAPHDLAPDSKRQTADTSARIEARGLLLQALDELDDDKRAVIVLYEVEGLSMKEVAEALSCPLQTAYSRLHAARATIAAFLGATKRGAA